MTWKAYLFGFIAVYYCLMLKIGYYTMGYEWLNPNGLSIKEAWKIGFTHPNKR